MTTNSKPSIAPERSCQAMRNSTNEAIRELIDTLSDDDIYILVDIHDSWLSTLTFCAVVCVDTGMKIKELLKEYLELDKPDDFEFYFRLKAFPVVTAENCSLKLDLPFYRDNTYMMLTIPFVDGMRLPMEKPSRKKEDHAPKTEVISHMSL